MQLQVKKKIYGGITILTLLFICILCLVPMQGKVSVCVEYAREYENRFVGQLFWKTNGEYSEQKSFATHVKGNKAEFEIADRISEIEELRFDPVNVCQDTAITSIQIRNYGIGINMIPVRVLMEKAKFQNLEQPEVVRGGLELKALNDDPSMVLDAQLLENYFAGSNVRLRSMLVIWLVLIWGVLLAGVAYWEKIKSAVEFLQLHYFAVTCLILGVAVFLAGYMALNSFDYAHPDENMSKAAIDYYMTHWKTADIRDTAVIDSFSAYGSSRLSELTAYYFLAGKTAWIAKNLFGIKQYYRVFNVLLLVLMTVVYFRKGKKNSFLFMLLGLTPQVWYIFSYATSDGWDYFLMFLLMYQMLVKDSMLNRALEETRTVKWLLPLLAVGIGYGLLMLGKKNYYFVLLVSFVIFLEKLIKSEKKVFYLWKYGIIVLICLSVFGGRLFAEHVRYDGDKDAVKLELRKLHAEEEYSVHEDGSFLQEGIQMKSRGVKLKDLFETYHWGAYSFKSFAGTYGWMEYEGSTRYYAVVALIYIGILLYVTQGIFCYANKDVGTAIGVNLMIPAVIILSVYNSWIADFQPQGRYLFPVLAIVTYDFFRGNQNEIAGKYQTICSLGLSVLGCFSFVFYGINNLV